jgi:Type II CAAX prenyl endopeptidase Rce1-like
MVYRKEIRRHAASSRFPAGPGSRHHHSPEYHYRRMVHGMALVVILQEDRLVLVVVSNSNEDPMDGIRNRRACLRPVGLSAGFMRLPVPHWSTLLIVLTSVTAGFCEEFLFRGFLISVISRAGLGWIAQILWSSVAFGAGHISMGPWGIVWAIFVGLLFASITIRRRNVWAAVTAHILVDTCVLLQLFPPHP